MALLFSAIFALEVASKLFNSLVENSPQNTTLNSLERENASSSSPILKPQLSTNFKMRQKIEEDFNSGDFKEKTEEVSSESSSPVSMFEVLPQFEALKMRVSQRVLEDEDILGNDFDFFGDNGLVVEEANHLNPLGEYDYQGDYLDNGISSSPFLSVKFEDFYDKLQGYYDTNLQNYTASRKNLDHHHQQQEEEHPGLIMQVNETFWGMNTSAYFPDTRPNQAVTFRIQVDSSQNEDSASLVKKLGLAEAASEEDEEVEDKLATKIMKIVRKRRGAVEEEEDLVEADLSDLLSSARSKRSSSPFGSFWPGFGGSSNNRNNKNNKRILSRRGGYANRRWAGGYQNNRQRYQEEDPYYEYENIDRGGGYHQSYHRPRPHHMPSVLPYLLPAFLGLGALLGFSQSSVYYDGEANTFDFSPNITYEGDNQVINITDIDTFTNDQAQQVTNTVTSTNSATNTNSFTSTVIPISLNGDGVFIVGPIVDNGGRRKRRDTTRDDSDPLELLWSEDGNGQLLEGPTVQMFLDRRAVPMEARARLREFLGDAMHVISSKDAR